MYPRSAKFDAAMQQSHVIATGVQVYDQFGNFLTDLSSLWITEGQVTVSDQDLSRRTVDFTMSAKDSTQVPSNIRDMLAPRNSIISMQKGIKYQDGTTELIQIGTFMVKGITMTDSGDSLTMEFQADDFAYRMSRSPFADWFTIPKGTNVVTAMNSIIAARAPWVIWSQQPTVGNVTQTVYTYEPGSSPWDKLEDLASSIGYEIFFDPWGQLVSRSIPDFTTTPIVWTFDDSQVSTTMAFYKQLTDQDFYNHVVVIGSTPGTGVPVKGEAADNDPSSLTNIALQGDLVEVLHRNDLSTAGACAQVAQAELQLKLGLTETVRLNSIVHPAFETKDTILIRRGVGSTKPSAEINARYIIDKISLPLPYARGMDVMAKKRATV